MKKPHYMPFYPEAWKASPRLAAMPATARAGYFDLLCSIWLNGGSLPNDDAMLAACARLTPKEWKANRKQILGMLTVEDGQVSNDRLSLEYQKSVEKIDKRKAAADKRWGNANASDPQCKSNANASDPQCKSNAYASGLHVQNDAFAYAVRTRIRTRDSEGSNEPPESGGERASAPAAPPSAGPPTPKKLKPPEPERRPFGEFGNVRLSEAEHDQLVEKMGHEAASTYIEAVDTWIAENPADAKRKNRLAYPTILTWHRRDLAEGRTRTPKQQQENPNGRPLGAIERRRLESHANIERALLGSEND